MKCPHCGAQIGLEEKYCPFCGLPNEFARKHQEDMDRYEQEFQQTQSEVYQKTRHFTSLTVPLTVIFVLILLNIVSFVFVAILNFLQFKYFCFCSHKLGYRLRSSKATDSQPSQQAPGKYRYLYPKW